MAKLATLPKPFDFDDVMLVPEQCIVSSRKEVNTSVTFGNHTFELPIVPANMSTIIDESLAIWLAKHGYFYIMHRFNLDSVSFAKMMHKIGLPASISVGVQERDFAMVEELSSFEKPVDYITVDIAHGDVDSVYRIVEKIKSVSPDTFVIAGNVATPEASRRLETAGADAVKVGIGPGSACLTSPHTGFGTRGWQLSAIEWCATGVKEALVIADGGIKSHGDIAKALAFGADLVMVGGMFAGHDESPGALQEIDGKHYKMFFGSASAEQKGNSTNVEGKSMLVEYRGPIENTLKAVKENLQSAVSYAGGKDLNSLQSVSYVRLK